VVSNERYEELVAEGASLNGYISVDVQTNLLEDDYTQGIAHENLTQSEIEKGYKTRIPLCGPSFYYPIIYITLEVITPKSETVTYEVHDEKTGYRIEEYTNIFDYIASYTEIRATEYEIEDGNLYFYFDLDDFAIASDLTSYLGYETFHYKINIQIQTVVPYEEEWETTTPASGQYGDRMGKILVEWEYSEPPEVLSVQESGDTILDTTSNQRAKIVLAQTTSYLLADYFNVFNLASELASSQVEEDYTALVTAISTLWSSIILLPLTVITAGTCAYLGGISEIAKQTSQVLAGEIVKVTAKKASTVALTAMLKTLIGYTISIPIQIISETWEELYLDPLIESLMLNWLIQSGTSQEVADFWVMFVCSFREAFLGPASSFIGGSLSGDLQQKLSLSSSQDSSQTSDVQSQATAALEANQEAQAIIKSHKRREALFDFLSADRIASIALSVPSFFVGGGGLASLAQIFDLSSDFLFDKQLDEALGEESTADSLLSELNKQQHSLEKLNKLFQEITAEQESVPITPATKNPIQSLFTSGFVSLDQKRLMSDAFQRFKTNLQLTEELKVNSESDSNENSFEIFVTDAEQAAVKADPVVEINGMRIWIQPLPADIYHLDHDMTLNDFLALIGILNDPSKQAIYINPQTGATYILNIFDGNMPLTEVLDLIGYDRNNLELQFLGNAHRIQIINPKALSQLQADISNLFNPGAREAIFYRNDISDSQRSYFSEKLLKVYQIQQSEIENTFDKSIYEIVYNTLLNSLPTDIEFTLEEWKQEVDDKAKQEGQFTEEFRSIVDLCLKEVTLLNLIELSGAKELDINEIFDSLDNYLKNNLDALINQLSDPKNFALLLAEVKNKIIDNLVQDGLSVFLALTHRYFDSINPNPSLLNLMDEQLQNFPILKNEGKIESEYKGQLDALSLLFYRIREYLNDQSIRDLPINDLLLGLHGPGDPSTYTKQHLANVLKDLGLNDVKKLQNMHQSQKYLYKTLLEQIQYDIQNNQDSAFKAYSKLLSGSIGSGKYFTEQELELVKRVDDVLNEVLGYVGYTLLKLGFITFDGNEQINFQMPTPTDTQTSREILEKIIRVLGLNSIAEFGTNNIETLLFSMLFSGHYMNLMTIGNDGQIELRKEFTYPGWEFFSDIYSSFTYLTPDPIYHLVMLQNFMNSEIIENRLNFYRMEAIPGNDMGEIYTYPKQPGTYRTKSLRSLIYNEKLNFDKLDLKFMLRHGITQSSITPLEIFDTVREKIPGWRTVFHGSRPAMFFKFSFEYSNQGHKSGFIFAEKSDGGLYLPGYSEPSIDGPLKIDPTHSFSQLYPARFIDGKWRTYDVERVGLFVAEDKDQLDINSVLSGSLHIYSEIEICRNCMDNIARFLINHPNIQIVLYHDLRNNPNNAPIVIDINTVHQYLIT
jgi:hypothetical protein